MKKILLNLLLIGGLQLSNAQSVTINNTLTDTDVYVTLFLNYEDINNHCRALCVTDAIPVPPSGTYSVATITANGWWAGGCVPVSPPDLLNGPFFTGAQISHKCEGTSTTPTGSCPHLDYVRVGDMTSVCYDPASGVQQSDCFNYSTGCGGGASCFPGQKVSASWSGSSSATLTISH